MSTKSSEVLLHLWKLCVRFQGASYRLVCEETIFLLLPIESWRSRHLSHLTLHATLVSRDCVTGITENGRQCLLQSEELNFLVRFLKNTQMSKFIKVGPVGAELLHMDGHDETNSRLSRFLRTRLKANGNR